MQRRGSIADEYKTNSTLSLYIGIFYQLRMRFMSSCVKCGRNFANLLFITVIMSISVLFHGDSNVASPNELQSTTTYISHLQIGRCRRIQWPPGHRVLGLIDPCRTQWPPRNLSVHASTIIMASWHISRRHKVANGDLLVSMMLIQLFRLWTI